MCFNKYYIYDKLWANTLLVGQFFVGYYYFWFQLLHTDQLCAIFFYNFNCNIINV